MGRTAFLDPVGGVSGDMMLSALLDAGLDLNELVRGLKSMALPDWELQAGRTLKCGIDAATLEVVVGGVAAGSASMIRPAPADHPGGEGSHEHSHGGGTHTHSHEGRNAGSLHHTDSAGPERDAAGPVAEYRMIDRLIAESALPQQAKDRARAVYRRLAEAEARAHGTALDEVHFHEVGAVDSIVDVVGAVYGLELLGVDRVVCGALPMGHGFIQCEHGMMPVPPPATAYLLENCPVRPVDVASELVTPTGAALVSALADEWGHLPAGTVRAVGLGAGSRDHTFPNILRVFLLDEAGSDVRPASQVALIEANVDDQTPELLAAAAAELMEAGALDVWLTPIVMKRGRAAQTLHCLCAPEARDHLALVLLRTTTSFGVRFSTWERLCLERDFLEVETEYGPVRVKRGRHSGDTVSLSPEFADCAERARQARIPVRRVYEAATIAAGRIER